MNIVLLYIYYFVLGLQGSVKRKHLYTIYLYRPSATNAFSKMKDCQSSMVHEIALLTMKLRLNGMRRTRMFLLDHDLSASFVNGNIRHTGPVAGGVCFSNNNTLLLYNMIHSPRRTKLLLPQAKLLLGLMACSLITLKRISNMNITHNNNVCKFL